MPKIDSKEALKRKRKDKAKQKDPLSLSLSFYLLYRSLPLSIQHEFKYN